MSKEWFLCPVLLMYSFHDTNTRIVHRAVSPTYNPIHGETRGVPSDGSNLKNDIENIVLALISCLAKTNFYLILLTAKNVPGRNIMPKKDIVCIWSLSLLASWEMRMFVLAMLVLASASRLV